MIFNFMLYYNYKKTTEVTKMTFKHYVNCIDSGFPEKYDLEVFIKAIEGDEEISDRQYEYLRHKAIECFYE